MDPEWTVAGLVVAGLGAVFAYTQLGLGIKDTDTRAAQVQVDVRVDAEANKESKGAEMRKGKLKRKKKSRDGRGTEGKAGKEGRGNDQDLAVPGDFDVAIDVARDVGGGVKGGKLKRRKKKSQGRQDRGGSGAGSGDNEDRERDRALEGDEEGDETDGDKELRMGTGTVMAMATGTGSTTGEIRSGNTTDDASNSPTPVSASTTARPKAASSSSSTRPVPPIRPSLSFDTDSSWTHVDRRFMSPDVSAYGSTALRTARAEMETSSDIGSTDPESGSPIAESGGADMHGTHTRGSRSQGRVASIDGNVHVPALTRVQPPADESPVPGFSWDDYADVVEDSVLVHDADEEDEGEWGIVKSRNRTRIPQTTLVSASQAPAAPEIMTKKQRQNARKRELAKAAKAEAESARLQGLAKHKRELERLRIIEQSQQGGGKRPSGGMQATVDNQGKLVWE